jgi:PAS domain S-box-containing protein
MIRTQAIYGAFSKFLREKVSGGSIESLLGAVPSKLLLIFPDITAIWYIQASQEAGLLRSMGYSGPKELHPASLTKELARFDPEQPLQVTSGNLSNYISRKWFDQKEHCIRSIPLITGEESLEGFFIIISRGGYPPPEETYQEIECLVTFLSIAISQMYLERKHREIKDNYDIILKGFTTGTFAPVEEISEFLAQIQETAHEIFHASYSVLFRREGAFLVSQFSMSQSKTGIEKQAPDGELRIPFDQGIISVSNRNLASHLYGEKLRSMGLPKRWGVTMERVIALPLSPYGKELFIIAIYYQSLSEEEFLHYEKIASSFSELATSSVESSLNRMSLSSNTRDLLEEKGKIGKLLHLTNLVNFSLDWEHAIEVSVAAIKEFFDGFLCGIITMENDRFEGHFACESSGDETQDQTVSAILCHEKYPQLTAQSVATTGMRISDPADYSFTLEERELLNTSLIHSLMILPIIFHGERIGTVLVGRNGENTSFSEREVKFGEVIANQIATSIRNSRLHSEVVKSRNEWELIFNSMSDGIFILDRELKVINFNQTFINQHGLNPLEIMGLKCFDLFRCGMHETDGCPHKRCIEKKAPVRGIYSDLSIPGTFRVSISPIFDDEGNVERTVHFLTDMTREMEYENKIKSSLKQAEEASRYLETLIESSPDTIISTDTERNIVYFNRSASELLGYSSEEVLGSHISLIYPSREEPDRLKEALLQGKGKVRNHHTQLLRKDGSQVEVILSLSIIFDEEGRQLGTVGILKDLSRIKEMEEHLRQAEKLSSLGKLASGIAHDFNNILAVISMRAELLKSRVEDPELVKDITVLENAAMQGADTVNKLKSFYKREHTELETIDMNEIIRQAVEITSPKWKDVSHSKGIVIEVELDLEDELQTIEGNPADLKDSLINMIFNALDAMPRGGHVHVKTKNLPGAIQITVSDSGSGMNQEVRERAFEPFFSTKGEEGSGLGLSSVYGVIQSHGGYISIDSEAGKGTDITIKFPISHRKVITLHPSEEELIDNLTGTSVYIFEDDDDIRESVTLLLEQKGCKAWSFQNGREGIAHLQEKLPMVRENEKVVVITDLGMPEMNGFEIAKRAKSLNARVPVIMITGWGRFIGTGKELLHGVDKFIPKPLRIHDLICAISELSGGD